MNSSTDVKPQMLIRSTLYNKSKKLLSKSLTNLKSFMPRSSQKQPKTPISPKLEKIYTSFSGKCCATNPLMRKDGKISEIVERKKDGLEKCRGVKELKEEMRAKEWSTTGVGEDVLAKKKRDLEMMEWNDYDIDNALDVEEVLHYYSLLTCPLYVQIVDQFLMDMYSDLQPSRSLHSSMRKPLSSDSMRSLGPFKL